MRNALVGAICLLPLSLGCGGDPSDLTLTEAAGLQWLLEMRVGKPDGELFTKLLNGIGIYTAEDFIRKGHETNGVYDVRLAGD